MKAIGDPLVNIGVFALAVLKQPHLTTRTHGRFVLVHNEDTTSAKLLSDWSDITGKPSEYVMTSLEDYDRLWPGLGMEMGVMLAMWNELKEDSWSGEEGVVGMDELGIKQSELTTVKEAYEVMDWNALL